jgi:hypothetical protein
MGFSFTDDASVTCTGFPTINAEGCRVFWIKSDDGIGGFGAKLKCGEVKTPG